MPLNTLKAWRLVLAPFALLLAIALATGACTGAVATNQDKKDVAADVATTDTAPQPDVDTSKPDTTEPDVAVDTITAACKCGDGTCDKGCETAAACPIDCGTPECKPGDASTCDDKNTCTKDTCSDAGLCAHAPLAGQCNDGNICTSKDTCSGSKCQGGAPLVCDDGNICTDDSCDPTSGCMYVANKQPCSDDDVCTVGDACALGLCQSGAPTVCDDFNACTQDMCEPGKGCAHLANDATACTVGDACTTVDACISGQCVGSALLQCDDGKACTLDGCDKNVGCTHSAIVGTCDDGNPCTTEDACSGDACVGGPAKNCDDLNPCTDDACSTATGCTHTANFLFCDDGDACTVGDACVDSACLPGAVTTCADDNLCTTDSCDKTTGCSNVNNTVPCSDGNACTVGDACKDAACLPGALTGCDDGNVCTEDSCDPIAGCANVNYAADCSDGNACTIADICSGGVCMAGEVTDCADGSACTADVCDPKTGCAHLPINVPCSDGSVCTTVDTCVGGVCVGTLPAVCFDENPCTNDTCDAVTGCVFPPNTAACSDGDACTSGDTCKDSGCVGGPPTQCDDLNPCTADSCYTIGGCVHVPLDIACDDGNACTTKDHCTTEGQCNGGPAPDCNDANPCTDDSCDKAKGCQHATNTLPCNDLDVCTTVDVCSEGGCVGTLPQDCNDKNPCTDDSCNAVQGCVHVANSLPCQDGSACTVGDVCADAACQPGAALPCDDKNVCTDDSCNPASGCVIAANTSACDDGNACTTADTCAAKVCVGGAAPNCDDANVCTTDACAPSSGCTHTANTLACNDANVCTTVDTCLESACVGTTPLPCTDGKVCTFDLCDAVKGCNFPPAVYFGDDFSTDTKGWAMEGDWMIGPAQVSIPYPAYNTPPNMFTSGFPDPKSDHTLTNDNGEAGTMIGGYTLRQVTPTYYMTSPVVDLSKATGDVWLQFWRYLNTDYTGYMEAYIEVYDGAKWVPLMDYAANATTDDHWTLDQFNVTAYKTAKFQVRYAFGIDSADAMSMSGWNLDDVRLVPATTCAW